MYQSDVGWPSSPARADRKSLWWWGGVLGLVALCLGWLFADALGLLWQNYRRPEYSHGYIVPAVTAFVVWHRWPALSRERARGGGWAGLALVGVALVVLGLSRLAHTGTPQALALVIALAGVALAGLGRRAMRHLWVPLAFLLFALPLPSTVHVLFSLRLQLISSGIGAWLLQLAGVSVFLDGNVIDLGGYRLQVAEACSGLRYLFPLGAFSFLCAWLYRGPFRDRVVIFLSAVPITIVMNSIRIALTGLLVEHGSVALAEGFLHLFEGWVIFLAALAALFALMWLLTRLRGRRVGPGALLDFDRVAAPRRAPAAAAAGSAAARPGGSTTGTRRGRPPEPLLACCGLLLAGALTLGWLTERAEIIPERPGLGTFPMRLGDWRGWHAAPDAGSLELLRNDGLGDYLLAEFGGPGQPSTVNLWVAYYPTSQSALLASHSPQACLPGAGWEFAKLEQVPAPTVGAAGGTMFPINRALIVNGRDRALMYYWYEARGRQFANEFWVKVYFLIDAITRGRSDSALVRLLTPIADHETIADAEARLSGFFGRMYPHLGPHVGA